MSYHVSHNNYRAIELRHSSHQVDSLALTQASVNQLPGSSGSSIGRFLSAAVFLITAGSFRRSQGLKSSSINPRIKKVKISCWKRMRRSSYSEQCILKHVFFHRKTVRLDYFEALFVFSICVDVSPQKSEKLPIKLWHHNTEIPFSGGCDNHFLVKKCVFLTEYVIQWWSSLTV